MREGGGRYGLVPKGKKSDEIRKALRLDSDNAFDDDDDDEPTTPLDGAQPPRGGWHCQAHAAALTRAPNPSAL